MTHEKLAALLNLVIEAISEKLKPFVGRLAKSFRRLPKLEIYTLPVSSEAAAAWSLLDQSPRFHKIIKFFEFEVRDASQVPDEDFAVQTVFSSRSGQSAAWPLLVVRDEDGRIVFATPVLADHATEKILEDLLKVLWIEKKMPDGWAPGPRDTRDEEVGGTWDRSFLVASIHTPWVQSWQPKFGLFGEKRAFFSAQHYAPCVGVERSRLADLAGFRESSDRFGEFVLSQLFVGPAWDWVEGGVFRTVDLLTEEPSTEKLLIHQIELLDLLSVVVKETNAPFLKDCFFELLRHVIEDFGEFKWGALGYRSGDLRLKPRDLLSGFEPSERIVAQDILGITGDHARLPRLQKSVGEIAKASSVAPMDLKLAAQSLARKLRGRRAPLVRTPAATWTRCRAVQLTLRAVVRLGRADAMNPQFLIAAKADLLARTTVPHAGARDGLAARRLVLCQALLAAELLKNPELPWPLPKSELTRLATVGTSRAEWGEAAAGAPDAIDHMGASLALLELERAAALAVLGLQPRAAYDELALRTLARARRYGLAAAGILSH